MARKQDHFTGQLGKKPGQIQTEESGASGDHDSAREFDAVHHATLYRCLPLPDAALTGAISVEQTSILLRHGGQHYAQGVPAGPERAGRVGASFTTVAA